jgi:hypothetical protein
MQMPSQYLQVKKLLLMAIFVFFREEDLLRCCRFGAGGTRAL